MNRFKNLNIVLLLAVMLVNFSCTKEEGPLSDLKPTTPILVSNAIAFRPEPTVTVSKSAIVGPGVVGPIQITLSIPASSPRTITSITKIAAATAYSQIQNLSAPPAPYPVFYNTAPVLGSGKTATFNTTLTEYTAKTGQPVTATNTELGRRFYFLVTLDDNTEVISEAVRVLVQD
jgi:hypothetical protein